MNRSTWRYFNEEIDIENDLEFLAGDDADFGGEDSDEDDEARKDLENESDEEQSNRKNNLSKRTGSEENSRKVIPLHKREKKLKDQVKKIQHKKIKVAFENADEAYNADLLN
jgi:hypothetical protein